MKRAEYRDRGNRSIEYNHGEGGDKKRKTGTRRKTWTYDLYGPVRNAFDAGKPITRAMGGGWALEIESFLGPVKWHRAVRRVPLGVPKS